MHSSRFLLQNCYCSVSLFLFVSRTNVAIQGGGVIEIFENLIKHYKIIECQETTVVLDVHINLQCYNYCRYISRILTLLQSTVCQSQPYMICGADTRFQRYSATLIDAQYKYFLEPNQTKHFSGYLKILQYTLIPRFI